MQVAYEVEFPREISAMQPLPDAIARLQVLTERARSDLALMAYPSRGWVKPFDTPLQPVYDVLIVGAGQSGLAAGLALKRDGVTNLVLIDQSPPGWEGPWETYARMQTLRTPKFSVGLEGGIPSLSARAWFEARYGSEAWLKIERVPRGDWMDYLRWFRQVIDLPIRNETRVGALEPVGDNLIAVPLTSSRGSETVFARQVILATGFDGCGVWRIPPHIEQAVPASSCTHSNVPIDMGALIGKRIGILGHGASAFDTAGAALRAGAKSVDICYRRKDIPQVNPHRQLEYAGLLKHFAELPVALRWEIAHFFDTRDQPPTQLAYDTATAFSNCRVHAASPWEEVSYRDGVIHVRTPHAGFEFDHVICATGVGIDLSARLELSAIARRVLTWSEVYTPPPGLEHPVLGQYPFLGPHYELKPKSAEEAWMSRIYAYNFCGYVSMGSHSTSVSAHKHSIPRMVRGITAQLLAEQADTIMPGIAAYDEIELKLTPSARPIGQTA
jgi:cation diffusion facilitator CzcD-associated flavoprotein CzcO